MAWHLLNLSRITTEEPAMRIVLLLSTLVTLAACGGGGQCTTDTAKGTSDVFLVHNAFSPDCIKVTQGGTLTFLNEDAVTHTVTADAGQAETFDSGNIDAGGSFQHQFNTAGTFGLHCSIHSMMTATVVVR
jgi:plastocyanin